MGQPQEIGAWVNWIGMTPAPLSWRTQRTPRSSRMEGELGTLAAGKARIMVLDDNPLDDKEHEEKFKTCIQGEESPTVPRWRQGRDECGVRSRSVKRFGLSTF